MKSPGFFDCVKSDLRMYSQKNFDLFAFLKYLISEPGFFISFIYRVQRRLLGFSYLGIISIKFLDLIVRLTNSCFISYRASIGPGLLLPHATGIVIGEGVKLGEGVIVYQGVTIGQNKKKYPDIGSNVIIYPGAVIVGDIRVNDSAVIGPNAVVIDNIESGCVVVNQKALYLKRDNI